MPGISVTFDLPAFKGDIARLADRVAFAHRKGMEAVAEGMADDLFQMVDQVWPNTKLANAIGAAVDNSRSTPGRLHAVVYAKSKNADRILDGFSKGAVIQGKNGQYLCIPTKYTPKQPPWGEKWWTPLLLWRHFARHGFHFTRTAKGTFILWMRDVVRAKSGRGIRAATKRRVAAGRKSETVPILYLVPLARLRRRLSPEAIAARWGERAPEIIEKALEAVINDG